jgi:hypothetical protein
VTIDAIEHDGRSDPAPDPGGVLEVETAAVTVCGRVESERALESADCNHATLNDFPKEKCKSFRFRQPLTLKPGLKANDLAFNASDARTTSDPRQIGIRYRPALPDFKVLAPKRVLVPGELETTLDGLLTETKPGAKLAKLFVQVNGGRKDEATVEADGGVTSKLNLRRGDNEVLLTLTNDYGRQREESVHVYCPQPPAEVKVDGPARTGTPEIQVGISIQSDLPLTGVRVLVRAKGETAPRSVTEFSPDRIPKLAAPNGGPARYGVSRLDVAGLVEGDNEVVAFASNRDGQSPEPGRMIVNCQPPAKPLQVSGVQILCGDGDVGSRKRATDGKVDTPRCNVSFVVYEQNGNPVDAASLLVDGVPVRGIGFYTEEPGDGMVAFETKTPVPLARGGAHTITAVIKGRKSPEAQVHATVTYVPPPVQVRLVALWDPEAPRKPPIEADADGREQGEYAFKGTAHTGFLRLEGELVWEHEEDALRENVKVRASVNGFVQTEKSPAKAEGKVSKFTIPLLLNRDYNRGEITVSGVAKSDPATFQIRCLNPLPNLRLNLVAFGPTAPNERALAADALSMFRLALPAEAPLEQGWIPLQTRPGAFAAAGITVLRRTAKKDRFLEEIEMLLTPRKTQEKDEQFNDVTVVYFRGEEVNMPPGDFLLTAHSRTERDAGVDRWWEAAVDRRELASRLADLRGAKLLFLDVRKENGGTPARFSDPARGEPGVVWYAWVGRNKTPEDERLCRVVAKFLPESAKLKEVMDQVEKHVRERAKPGAAESVQFARRTNADLDDIPIGSGRSANSP